MIAILLGILVLVALVWYYPWVLVVPVIFIAISYPIYHVRRYRSLKKRGYFLVPGKEGGATYEESSDGDIRSINLPSYWTAPGEAELFIPSIPEWKETAPDWAQDRRDEIFLRVVSLWFGAAINYPPDWPSSQARQMKKRNKSAHSTAGNVFV